GGAGTAHPGQGADVGDGLFSPLGDAAAPAVELQPLLEQPVAQQAVVHGGGDLGRAGSLGPVAHHAGEDRQRVDDGMGDDLIAAAVQPGDAAGGPHPGAGGPAEGGQAADAGFLVDGDQVGHQQRAQQRVVGQALFPRVDDHRHRGGQPLVAAARNDGHRQFAAAHAGVAARGGRGGGAGVHIPGGGAEQRAPHLRAPGAAQPFFGGGHTAVDLPLQQFAHVVQVGAGGKVQDVLHRHGGAVGLGGGLGAGRGGGGQGAGRAVPLQHRQVGVEILDHGAGVPGAAVQPHFNVKD